jgi:hypothetical protein
VSEARAQFLLDNCIQLSNKNWWEDWQSQSTAKFLFELL